MNGSPLQLAEAAVDAADQLVDRRLHFLVAFDPDARGDDHHHQHHLAVPVLVVLQKPLERQQPIGDALGVVEAVDRQHDPAVPQRSAQFFPAVDDLFRSGQVGKAVELDAHRKRVHLNDAVGENDASHLMFPAQDAADALEKVLRVVVRMKADQVGAEDAFQEGFSPRIGHQPEHLERGEGDVKEKADAQFRQPFLQQGRQQEQVIVVDPHQIVRRRNFHHRIAEDIVDPLVAGPGALVVIHQGGEIVEQGPERIVAKTLVKRLDVFVREEHRGRGQLVPTMAQSLIAQLRTHGAAGPADPDVFLLNGLGRVNVGPKARGQAAWALAELELPIHLLDRHGQTVGDDDEFHGRPLQKRKGLCR